MNEEEKVVPKAKAKPKPKAKASKGPKNAVEQTRVKLEECSDDMMNDPRIKDFYQAVLALTEPDLYQEYRNVRFTVKAVEQFKQNLNEEFKLKKKLREKQKVVENDE